MAVNHKLQSIHHQVYVPQERKPHPGILPMPMEESVPVEGRDRRAGDDYVVHSAQFAMEHASRSGNGPMWQVSVSTLVRSSSRVQKQPTQVLLCD